MTKAEAKPEKKVLCRVLKGRVIYIFGRAHDEGWLLSVTPSQLEELLRQGLVEVLEPGSLQIAARVARPKRED